MEKLFQAKVSGEATKGLKHVSCNACERPQQPPARRQVAIAHAGMFNDAVSMDVNFWKQKERSNTGKKTVTVLNIGDNSEYIASRVQIRFEHAVRKPSGFFGKGAKLSQSGSPSCTDQQGII